MSVNLIIFLDNSHILTDKLNPLSAIVLQAHWARAKRQQHLPKELVLSTIISALSIIHQDKDSKNRNQNAQVPTCNLGYKQVGLSSFSIIFSLWIFRFLIQTKYLWIPHLSCSQKPLAVRFAQIKKTAYIWKKA